MSESTNPANKKPKKKTNNEEKVFEFLEKHSEDEKEKQTNENKDKTNESNETKNKTNETENNKNKTNETESSKDKTNEIVSKYNIKILKNVKKDFNYNTGL